MRPRVNLKLVPKFQVFCYTVKIKCKTLYRLPKKLYKLTDFLCLTTVQGNKPNFAWRALPWSVISPNQWTFHSYYTLVNHYLACFIIIRHKFIISTHIVLSLGTCSSLLGTGSSLLGTCPTLLGTSPSLWHTTSLSSSTSFTIRHPFIIRYCLNFLGRASFISTFPKYLREEHCVASWVILASETPLQLETRQSQYQGLYSSLLGVVMIQGVESFITGKKRFSCFGL